MIDEGQYYDYEMVQLRLHWMLTGKKSKDPSIDEYKETVFTDYDKFVQTQAGLEKDRTAKRLGRERKKK